MALKAELKRLSAMPQTSGYRRMAGAVKEGGEVWTLTFVELVATRAASRAAPCAAATPVHPFVNTTAAAVAAAAVTAVAAASPAAAGPAAAAACTPVPPLQLQSPAGTAPVEIADGPPVLGPAPNDGINNEHDPEWEAGPERPTATVFGFQNAEVQAG